MSPTLMRAIRRAVIAHDGQYRKFTGIPYIVHPLEVLNILRTYTDDTEVLCAGVLHDTLEDTDYTFDQMLEEFGPGVAGIVLTVTHAPRGTWKQKRLRYLERIKDDPEASMIACADKVANLRDTITQGRELTKDERWYYQAVCALAPKAIGAELADLLALDKPDTQEAQKR